MKTIVEINGVKMEVDLREARTIDTYRVGDHVKVLIPEYSDSFKSMSGVIIGFDDFKKRPTIVLAYLDASYGKAEIKIEHFCEGSKVEITKAADDDLPFSKQQILELLDKNIADKQKALDEAEWHKRQFEKWFGKYFSQAAEEQASAAAHHALTGE